MTDKMEKPDQILMLGVYLLITVLCCMISYHLGVSNEKNRGSDQRTILSNEYQENLKRYVDTYEQRNRESVKNIYSEIVRRNFGQWKVDDLGEVKFYWNEE